MFTDEELTWDQIRAEELQDHDDYMDECYGTGPVTGCEEPTLEEIETWLTDSDKEDENI